MTCYTQFQTPFCDIILAGSEEGLSHLHLCTGEGKRVFELSSNWERDDAFFADTVRQIQGYFRGERRQFDVRLNLRGTKFQRRVWDELSRIPYGELRTYTDIARAMGNEKAARAVGMANSKNPIPLLIPCHRVVGANGALTGFAHGLTIKETLIQLEQKATPCSL